MAKFEETRTISNKSPTDCFSAAVRAYPKAGFNIWKKREIAWLALAKKNENGVEIDSNLSARPGDPTPVTLTLSANGLSVDRLREISAEIFLALDNEFK